MAYVVGVVWGVGRRIDGRALRAAVRTGAGVEQPVHAVLAYLSPVLVCGGLAVVVTMSARRGDRSGAAGALGLVVGSELVAQAMKLLLPRVGGGTNTLPSGHLTMIAAFVLLLVTARRWRRVDVALGVLVVVGSAVGTWVISWHRPSDTVAACGVVALCWGATRLVTDARAPRALADQPTVPAMRRAS